MKNPNKNKKLEKALIVSTLLVVVLFVIGTQVGLFQGLTWYDEIVHYIAGAWGGIIVFSLYTNYGKAIPLYEEYKKSPVVFITLAMILIGIGWELFEFGLVAYLETTYNASPGLQPSQFDTLTDLLLDGLGAGIAAHKLSSTEKSKI